MVIKNIEYKEKCPACSRYYNPTKFHTFGKQCYFKLWGKDYKFLCKYCEDIAMQKVNYEENIKKETRYI